MNRTLTTVAAAAAVIATSATADTNIVYGSWASSTDPASLAMESFTAEVAERSDGAVSFETHFDSAIFNLRTAMAGISDGLVDAGFMAGSVYQAELPIEAMAALYSTLEANPWSMSGAITEFMIADCDDCASQYDDQGIVPMAYATTPHFYLMCADPIESFEDLEGASIRASSGNLSFPAMVGGTAVSIPATEVYEALQRGQVDCLVGSVFWLEAFGLWDVVEYVLDLPFGQWNNPLVFAMNADAWADIPEEERAAIAEAMPTLIAEAARIGVAKADEVRAESIERGVNWAEPTDAMRTILDEWFEEKRTEVENWGTENGVANSGELLDQLEGLLAKWNGLVEGLDGDVAAYRQMLVDEIYADLSFN